MGGTKGKKGSLQHAAVIQFEEHPTGGGCLIPYLRARGAFEYIITSCANFDVTTPLRAYRDFQEFVVERVRL